MSFGDIASLKSLLPVLTLDLSWMQQRKLEIIYLSILILLHHFLAPSISVEKSEAILIPDPWYSTCFSSVFP